MLTELTPDQEKQLSVYRDKWIDIALSTEPVDKKAAEKGVELVYEMIDLPTPSKIMWVKSPSEGAKYIKSCSKDSNKYEYDIIYGQYDASWLGLYEYFEEVCGIECCKKLRGLQMIAKSAGWCWLFDDIAILSERPTAISLNNTGQLHSLTDMAIQYSDGWGLYCINGLRVDKLVVMQPDTITAEQIENEHNVEIRRVMIDRMGLDKYILESKATTVHLDEFGVLYVKEIDMIKEYWVRVTDKVKESDDSILKIHPAICPMGRDSKGQPLTGESQKKTAKNAIASTFYMRGEDYSPSDYQVSRQCEYVKDHIEKIYD